MSSMWSRLTGLGAAGGKGSLKAVLQTVTHTRVLNISEDLFAPIIVASHNPEDRPVIMKHLQDCLSEPSGKHWKRIYGGLVLLEMLLTSGSLELLLEIAAGLYFDLAQRLSFLEHFRCDNERVQTMVKVKTEKLHKDALPRLESRVGEMAGRSQERSLDLQTFFVKRPSAKNTAPGVAYRNSKDLEDRFHGNEIAFYDSFVFGRDEGDGWLRVGDLFLPIYLPGGERVLVTFQDASAMQKETMTPSEFSDMPIDTIDALMADMLSDFEGIHDKQLMQEREARSQELKKVKDALQKQDALITFQAGQEPEVFGKSV